MKLRKEVRNGQEVWVAKNGAVVKKDYNGLYIYDGRWFVYLKQIEKYLDK